MYLSRQRDNPISISDFFSTRSWTCWHPISIELYTWALTQGLAHLSHGPSYFDSNLNNFKAPLIAHQAHELDSQGEFMCLAPQLSYPYSLCKNSQSIKSFCSEKSFNIYGQDPYNCQTAISGTYKSLNRKWGMVVVLALITYYITMVPKEKHCLGNREKIKREHLFSLTYISLLYTPLSPSLPFFSMSSEHEIP